MTRSIPLLQVAILSFVTAINGTPPEFRIYRADPSQSSLYVTTHKSGLLSFLGHEHAIVPMRWAADLCLSQPIEPGARGTLRVEAGSLVIDTDSARTVAAMGEGPGEQERLQIQARMLDSDHLDTLNYPLIQIELAAVAQPEDGEIRTGGKVTIHGVTRTAVVPVSVREKDSGTLVLAGTLRIRQREWAIEPESIAGVVKVSNEVDLHFSLVVLRTEDGCEPAS